MSNLTYYITTETFNNLSCNFYRNTRNIFDELADRIAF